MFEQCLYFNTASLARVLEREWSEAFKPFGLTPPQAFMLRAVLDTPGLQQKELADLMVISRPTATRALDGLMAKGLIKRRNSELDGREFRIYPTMDATQIHASLNEASGKVTRRLKDLLGEDGFKDTVSKIRKTRGAFR